MVAMGGNPACQCVVAPCFEPLRSPLWLGAGNIQYDGLQGGSRGVEKYPDIPDEPDDSTPFRALQGLAVDGLS